MTPSRTARADLGLLGVALIWGCNFPVMKAALGEVHPFAFNAVRLTLSALLLAAIRPRKPGPLPPHYWPAVTGLSLLGSLLYQVLFLTGLDRTTAGTTSLLMASAPMWAALVGRLRGDVLRPGAWLGLAAAFAGTAWIATTTGEIDFGDRAFVGNLLALTAALCWGAYTAFGRGVARAVSPVTMAFHVAVISVPLHWLVALPHLDDIPTLSSAGWGAVAYSGLMATGVAYVLYNNGIRRVGPAHAAITINLVPVLAVAISALTLGEPVTAGQIGGGLLVLTGVWSMRRAR